MALNVNSCLMLALCACVASTIRAECGKDCALCIYRLMGQQTESNSLACTLECEGTVDARKLDLCRNTLTEEERVAVDNLKEEGESADHLLSKKYGGFMKRYGGFMIKKAEELAGGAQAEGDNPQMVSKKYGGFMKKDGTEGREEDKQLNMLREILNMGLSSEVEDQRDGGVSKRYGGFMRSVQGSSGQEEAGKELQKRYGGFMRRVGRPEWLDDHKSYSGILRRSWGDERETSLPNMEKRYGGFMD
ncbi:proenkephalin a [Chanos chanos]|uniref:Proenkephalin a n=1 Tax=Chanos chanos TaxID=29144 RepID=A0A6J2VFT1_CHACN|nr:proenkephalin-A-like [Chanos chanos]